MEQLNSTAANASKFTWVYILLAIPTYILPYLGSNSVIANVAYLATGGTGIVLLLLHVGLLVALCVIARARGQVVGKGWLVTLPVMAAIFDIVPVLNWIPLVPTLFHVATVVIGASDDRASPPDVFS